MRSNMCRHLGKPGIGKGFSISALFKSTPSTDSTSRRGAKRAKTRHPGSESSIDGDLSYLDLDSGEILAASREGNQISLSQTDVDKLMLKIDKMEENFSKIDRIERCLSKLDKLDKLN